MLSLTCHRLTEKQFFVQVLDTQSAEALLSEAIDTTVFVHTFCLAGTTALHCATAIELMQYHHERTGLDFVDV